MNENKKPVFCNDIYITERMDKNDEVYWKMDIDVSKFKYLLSQITRDDGKLSLIVRRKKFPTKKGLTHNVFIDTNLNNEFSND